MVLKRVFTRVDLPRPDSPDTRRKSAGATGASASKRRTDDHGGELEALPDALSVDLVGEVCETDIAHELFADNVRGCRLSRWHERRV